MPDTIEVPKEVLATLLRNSTLTSIEIHPNYSIELIKLISSSVRKCITIAEETPTDKAIAAAINLNRGAALSLHTNTPIETATEVAKHLNPGVILYLHPNTPIEKATEVAKHLNPGAKLSFHPNTRIEQAIEIVKHLNPDAKLSLHPNTPIEAAIEIAKHLNPGAILYPLPNTPIEKAIEIAKHLNPGAKLYFHPNTPIEAAIEIAKHLNPGVILYLHPNTPIEKATEVAKHLNPGVILYPLPNTPIEKATEVAKHLNPGAVLSLHPNTPIEKATEVAKHLNPGAILLLHPETSFPTATEVAKNLKTGAILLLLSKASLSTATEVAKNLKTGAILLLYPETLALTATEVAKNLTPGTTLLFHPKMPASTVTEITKNLTPDVMLKRYTIPVDGRLTTGATRQPNAASLSPPSLTVKDPKGLQFAHTRRAHLSPERIKHYLDYAATVARGNSRAKNNCTLLAAEILRALCLGKVEEASPRTSSKDQAHCVVTTTESDPAVKKEGTSKTLQHAVETSSIPLEKATPGNEFLAAGVIPFNDVNGILYPDIKVYDLTAHEQMSVDYKMLKQRLMQEASNNKNKVSFGMLNLSRPWASGTPIPAGHRLVYWASSDSVWFCDPQFIEGGAGEAVFNDISRLGFVGQEAFSPRIFFAPVKQQYLSPVLVKQEPCTSGGASAGAAASASASSVSQAGLYSRNKSKRSRSPGPSDAPIEREDQRVGNKHPRVGSTASSL